MATAAGGMAPATGGMATTGGAGGAPASGGLGGNNVAGDAGMGGEAGMMEVGGTAGSGTAGSGTAGSGTAGSGMAGSGMGGNGTGGASSGTFSLTIAGFTEGAGCTTAMRDTCAVWPRDLQQYMSGPNISPAMTWTGAPAGTQSFAVVLYDESSMPNNVHWAIWNIPASVMMLPADIPKTSAMPTEPAGSQQANLSSGDGYFGPGSECNVYSFTLYALGVPTFSPAQNTAASVRTGILALGDQLLGQVAVFGRQDFNGTCSP
jgi:Raf kinase inhibitor-like YbhB/YbcL family protein